MTPLHRDDTHTQAQPYLDVRGNEDRVQILELASVVVRNPALLHQLGEGIPLDGIRFGAAALACTPVARHGTPAVRRNAYLSPGTHHATHRLKMAFTVL